MTREEMRALFDEALGPINQRLAKLETAQPEAAPVDWEARARAAEAQLAMPRPTSGRRAMVPNHAFVPGDNGEGSQFRSLVNLAKSEGKARQIVNVSERHAKTLTADRYDPAVTRDHLEVALRDLVDGAIHDGIIRDPGEDPAWG